MKLKDSVRFFIEEQTGNVTLKQIIAAFPDKTPASVRGTLNLCAKNSLIVRVKRGVYIKKTLEEV